MSNEISEWLRDYGVEDFNGACTFTYKDVIDFSVETSTDQSCVILHSVICEVPTRSETEVLRQLLQWNYLGKETRGASLCLDPTGQHIVTWISLPIAILDVERFQQIVGSFLDLSEQLLATILPQDFA
ncbi:MAG: type III secretion system chaperone [Pirellulales bacterium]|nr:type III secretion system chaperone [Pirellulales bacterium]